MTQIEKSTISIPTAVVIVVFVGGLIGNYFTTISAVKSGIQEIKSETKLEIQELKGEDRMMQKDISDLRDRANKMEAAALTYMEGVKPESPEIKTR